MSEVLEATMLLCFGASWPISLVKNIKAKTAKTMSLQFILLIITGYLAGITAKLVSHRINYVLVVYLFKLIVVSINLGVYFVNRKKDRVLEDASKAKNWGESEMSVAAANKYVLEKTKYAEMNYLAEKDGIVFFGSTYLANIPVCELAQLFHLNERVYNRSIASLGIDETLDVPEDCILGLCPQKVFVNLGDAELAAQNLDIDEFLKKYEWLLYTIHTKTNAELYVISVFSESPLACKINARLKKLAEECGSTFIDTASALHSDKPDLRFFEHVKHFIRCHSMSFSEAMDVVTV